MEGIRLRVMCGIENFPPRFCNLKVTGSFKTTVLVREGKGSICSVYFRFGRIGQHVLRRSELSSADAFTSRVMLSCCYRGVFRGCGSANATLLFWYFRGVSPKGSESLAFVGFV